MSFVFKKSINRINEKINSIMNLSFDAKSMLLSKL